MANLIPMAGLGSRFADAGYTLPKPLISVSGEPMIINAIRDMPKSDKWIFVVRKEHVDEFKIDQIIKKELPNAIIIAIDKTTEGQACTCLLAEKYLDPEEPLLIAACDNGYFYDTKRYTELCSRTDIDAVVWTFTRKENLRQNPAAWGWIKLEDDGETIKDMSVKVPISPDPYNDHAVVATFYFKKTKDFIASTKMMIAENHRIKNEFYVDSLPIFLKKMKKKSAIFDVDLYVGWGTPKDLYNYQKIEFILENRADINNLSTEDRQQLNNWKEYFNKKWKTQNSR
jgi:dTDP-glucose pyrophosphorylase